MKRALVTLVAVTLFTSAPRTHANTPPPSYCERHADRCYALTAKEKQRWRERLRRMAAPAPALKGYRRLVTRNLGDMGTGERGSVYPDFTNVRVDYLAPSGRLEDSLQIWILPKAIASDVLPDEMLVESSQELRVSESDSAGNGFLAVRMIFGPPGAAWSASQSNDTSPDRMPLSGPLGKIVSIEVVVFGARDQARALAAKVDRKALIRLVDP